MNKYATNVSITHVQLPAKAYMYLYPPHVSNPETVLYENLFDVPITKALTATSSYISKHIKYS